MSNADILVCFVYVVYIAAPSIRQEFWLRLALFTTSVGFAVWGALLESWPVIAANVLFCLMSLRQIHRAYIEMQPVTLSDGASQFGVELFPAMLDRDLQRLWESGKELHVEQEELLSLGVPSDFIYAVLGGTLTTVLATGLEIETSLPTIIGEVSTLSESTSGAASATVTAFDARVLQWSKSDIEDLQKVHPSMSAPFLKGLASQMAARLVG